MIAAFCIAAAATAEDMKLLQEFRLKEPFGVSHADQVVIFELNQKADPDQCHLLNDAGREVACQIVAGGPHVQPRLLHRPSPQRHPNLQAHGGPRAQALDGVKIDESHADYIEIFNGLTGVRVPKVYAPLTTRRNRRSRACGSGTAPGRRPDDLSYAQG